MQILKLFKLIKTIKTIKNGNFKNGLYIKNYGIF